MNPVFVKDIPGSFRDPSGLVFLRGKELYRRINFSYKEDYDYLINSGLYEKLVSLGLLIPHKEVDIGFKEDDRIYKIIKPEPIPFISYPYEWCFSQLKDAGLLTLNIQRIALDYGMSLKDCSAYNIQFKDVRPIMIDTLSFERYRDNKPWVAYRQFCQHFLCPLALMSYKDIRLNSLLRIYIDGIFLDLADSILGFHNRFHLGVFFHIYLHSRMRSRYADRNIGERIKERKFNIRSLHGLIDSLESSIRRLTWVPNKKGWGAYYIDKESYSEDAINHKKQIISGFLDNIKPKVIWDIGANTGLFTRIAGGKGILAISFDIDPVCVELNYLDCVRNKETNILPLLMDITNPSPGIGWENQERLSLIGRGPVDMVLALAIIHHLAISNNIPFGKIASFFGKICRWLIIEFIPKTDKMVQKLLQVRDDIFIDYTMENFEKEFSNFFDIKTSVGIKDSERVLYLMQRRD